MAKSKKIGLGKRLGKAVKNLSSIAEKEVEMGQGGELPEIPNGVAKLVDCRFDIFKNGNNKGKPYFIAAGVVMAPEKVNSNGVPVRVKGLRTQIMIGLVDNPNSNKYPTVQSNIDRVLNELKKLGADVAGRISTDDSKSGDEIEELADELVQAGVHFNFRTWKGKATEAYPNPRINHDWMGFNDDFELDDDDEDDGVQDSSEEEEYEEVPDEDDSEQQEDLGDEEEKEDIMELAKQADKDFEAASEDDDPPESCKKIEELAKEHNVDGWEEMDTYVEIVEAIQSRSEGSIEVGSMVKYKKGRMKSPADAEVLADNGDGTFMVKNLSTDKEVKITESNMVL